MEHWSERIIQRSAKIGVLGLGYVGLPLALRFCKEGFNVLGVDRDHEKIARLQRLDSYIHHISPRQIKEALEAGFTPVTDSTIMGQCDALIICVPTPLQEDRSPQMRYIAESCQTIARILRSGQLIVLESSVWPGATKEFVQPILESSGLAAHQDFFLAYAPEREDPGQKIGHTVRLVSADDPGSAHLASCLYRQVASEVVSLSSTATAEAAKMLENTFRSVNIALVNEMKMVCEAMDIDVFEVIQAAATKPFGFMRFDPGPGPGGHCIPVDPLLLRWKARQHQVSTLLIDAADTVNRRMPERVIQRIRQALGDRGKELKRSQILLVGMAYKKNVDDLREAPGLRLMELLEEEGALVSYYDPYVLQLPVTRHYPNFAGRVSVGLERAGQMDAVVVVTDHDVIDMERLQEMASLIIDCRGVCDHRNPNVVRA